MRYRAVNLVYIINAHVIIMIFMYFGWMSSVRIWEILPIPMWTIYIPLSFGVNCTFMLLALKIYFLYYKQQYNLSILHKTYHREYSAWFIAHRNTWGNLWYILAVLFVPYILLTTVMYCVMYHELFESPISDASQAILVSTQLAFSAKIYFRV